MVATEHPGVALRVAYDSGHNVDYDPAAFGAGLDDVAYKQAIRSLGRTWATEAGRMLQALRAGEVAPHLQHLVNTRTLVTTGHSTGDAVAMNVCKQEGSCSAGVLLDAWMLPVDPAVLDRAGGLGRPVLAMFQDPRYGYFGPANQAAFQQLKEQQALGAFDVHDITIPWAGHQEFSDVALLSPIGRWLGLNQGHLPATLAHARVRGETVAWLRSTLPRAWPESSSIDK